MSDIKFEALPLAAPLQLALREHNYLVPSPIQAETIPHLLKGRDLLGCAQTGTGKTAAFALPMLHELNEAPKRMQPGMMRMLVLVPTRELAVQVAQSFQKYGKNVRFRVATVYGGVSQVPQVRALARGLDVVVATPGRLLDLFEQGHLLLNGVETLVLDEADRMLDMGFIHDMKAIVKEIPRQRQTIFFSATMSKPVRQLAEGMLKDPVSVSIEPNVTTAEKVDHSVCFVRKDDKGEFLSTMLQQQEAADVNHLTLVFTSTKHMAERLAKSLDRAGIRSDAIHGNKSQNARQRALDKFRTGETRVLVATDVAARGIDVKNITLVVNYDMPNEAESYVHRIGRTGRAGENGKAVSFCTDIELGLLRQIENWIKQPVAIKSDHPYHARELVDRYSRTTSTSGPPRGGQRGGQRGGPRGGSGGGGGFNKPRRTKNNSRHSFSGTR